ncbi:MAG TPA: VOC family protein [Steroidobacteraceae bacterium]|nr:VOC family protein [Steroidobacteraceae bacterium]
MTTTLSTAWGELDHIIIFCNVGAPEAGALTDSGLHEGPGNSHPGQGTANRRFFFPNAYLELLWVENRLEAQSPEARETRLWERWQQRASGACPFGLVFRPGPNAPGLPPASWTYAPGYFPPGFSIEVARDVPPNEPLLFYLPFARSSLVENVDLDEGTVHVGPITGATIHLPQTDALSRGLSSLVAAGAIAVEPAREYLLDLYHAGGPSQVLDLRPQLPLRLLPARATAAASH